MLTGASCASASSSISSLVRSAGFVERIQPLILLRQQTEIVEVADGVWALRETEVAYGKETGPKSAP